eukprot:TRINITY_DN29879_c0_g1_i1.p1 TRINITY_DN29879_c0_g1~~TRINITY_DN29879_c0_g1_i1.p1  ORF type:complete len:614 (+),score=44.35 TRINITY_DN29879_c0_g1_i1:34-1875(+)
MSAPDANSTLDASPPCDTNCTSGSSEVPGWVLGVTGTLAVLALVACIAALLWFWLRYTRAKVREQYTEETWGGTPLLSGEGPLEQYPDGCGGLSDADIELLETLLRTHGRCEAVTSPEMLPGRWGTYPRGPGRTPVSVPQSDVKTVLSLMYNHHAQLWYTKQIGVYDEIRGNLRLPTRLQSSTGLLCAIATRLDESAPLTTLATYLTTQEATDIDRMLLHHDAPVWVPGNKSGTRQWEGYEPRNEAVHCEIDNAADKILASNHFGDREEAYREAAKWVKLSTLVSETAFNEPRKRVTVYKAVRNPPGGVAHLINFKSFGGRTLLFWLTPVACTTSYHDAMKFLEEPHPDDGGKHVLYKFINADEWCPIETLSQYPCEKSVVLPMLVGYRIEAVRKVKECVIVVDLERVKGVDVDRKRLRSECLADAARGEEKVFRVLELVSRDKRYTKPPRQRGDIVLHRYDPTGCVRGVKEFDPEDTTRCHECGGLAHGLHRATSATPSTIPSPPNILFISGGAPSYSGCYHRTSPDALSWTYTSHTLTHLSHRWALISNDHPTHAHIVAVDETPASIMPHAVGRWARPVDGEWREDPSIRVSDEQPMVWDVVPKGNPLLES